LFISLKQKLLVKPKKNYLKKKNMDLGQRLFPFLQVVYNKILNLYRNSLDILQNNPQELKWCFKS